MYWCVVVCCACHYWFRKRRSTATNEQSHFDTVNNISVLLFIFLLLTTHSLFLCFILLYFSWRRANPLEEAQRSWTRNPTYLDLNNLDNRERVAKYANDYDGMCVLHVVVWCVCSVELIWFYLNEVKSLRTFLDDETCELNCEWIYDQTDKICAIPWWCQLFLYF